jgi:hypothetical protein
MAGLKLQVNWEDVDLEVNAWKTVASIRAGSDQALSIDAVKFAAHGVAGDAKQIKCRLQRITGGTGTGTATNAFRRNNTYNGAKRSICRTAFTAVPTAVTPPTGYSANGCLDAFHPQGGLSRELAFKDVEVEPDGEVAVQLFLYTGQTVVACTGSVDYTEGG